MRVCTSSVSACPDRSLGITDLSEVRHGVCCGGKERERTERRARVVSSCSLRTKHYTAFSFSVDSALETALPAARVVKPGAVSPLSSLSVCLSVRPQKPRPAPRTVKPNAASTQSDTTAALETSPAGESCQLLFISSSSSRGQFSETRSYETEPWSSHVRLTQKQALDGSALSATPVQLAREPAALNDAVIRTESSGSRTTHSARPSAAVQRPRI